MFACTIDSIRAEKEFQSKPNSVFEIECDIDLNGQTWLIPKNVTLKHKNGVIRNGKLIGNDTKIESSAAIFDHVSLSGTWRVPVISTSLFLDLNYTNSLKDVFSLASDDMQNEIYISKSNYTLMVDKENQSCIKIPSYSTVRIDGEITLLPNQFKHYNIFLVRGTDIHVTGTGSIIGDKDDHTGKEGEWGMGIRFSNAKNCSVTKIKIKDCWGDCIYIGGNSTDILVKKCSLFNGRRQGISVTSGRKIYIERCDIHDIKGTNPMYAIDIEPNNMNIVDSVFIRNVHTFDCCGGIMCTRSAKNDCYIGYMEISDCKVIGTHKKRSYKFKGADTLVLKRCTGTGRSITFTNVNHVVVDKNSIYGLHENQTYSYTKCRSILEK